MGYQPSTACASVPSIPIGTEPISVRYFCFSRNAWRIRASEDTGILPAVVVLYSGYL